MPVAWKTPESFERLLAAWWASSENHKPNYREIAKYFGKGATYDAIEGRFRHIKRQAELLKAEANSSIPTPDSLDSPDQNQSFASATSSTPKKPRAPRTPKKEPGSATPGRVASGRVGKPTGSGSASGTPSKRGRGRPKANADADVDAVAHQVKRENVAGGRGLLDEFQDAMPEDVDWMQPGSHGGVFGGEGEGVAYGGGGGDYASGHAQAGYRAEYRAGDWEDEMA